MERENEIKRLKSELRVLSNPQNGRGPLGKKKKKKIRTIKDVGEKEDCLSRQYSERYHFEE